MRPKAEEALDVLVDAAPYAADQVVEIMKLPPSAIKNRLGIARFQLSICKFVLEIAGIGAAAADQRHTELLGVLRGKLDERTYAQVVRALTELAESRGEGAGAPRDAGDKH